MYLDLNPDSGKKVGSAKSFKFSAFFHRYIPGLRAYIEKRSNSNINLCKIGKYIMYLAIRWMKKKLESIDNFLYTFLIVPFMKSYRTYYAMRTFGYYGLPPPWLQDTPFHQMYIYFFVSLFSRLTVVVLRRKKCNV